MKYIDNIGQSLSDAANFVGNKTVNLFKQDATGDYSTRKAALARQQKLADALTQMGAQEQAVYSAGGITAPMSGVGALARGLTSFGGGYLDRIAAADEAALKKAGSEELVKAISQFGKPYKTVDEAAPTVTEPGGEPIQQYTMKTPDSGEMLGEAARVMGLGAPGSEAIGAKLYSTASDAAERETAYNRLKPLIDQIPDEQAKKYFDIAAKADPAKAAAAFGDAGVSLMTPKKTTIRNPFAAVGPNGKPGMFVMGEDGVPVQVPGMAPFRTGGEGGGGSGGPFSGKSLSAQFMNTLIKGNTGSPEYALAYNSLSKPRVTVDPDTMQPITIPGMDMSQFPKPTGSIAPGATGLTPVVGAPVGESKLIKLAKVTLNTFDSQFKNLEDNLKKASVADKTTYATTGILRGGMANAMGAYNAMVTAVRDPELINTGVLQPAELKYMNDFLNSPGTIKGLISGDEATLNAFRQLRTVIANKLTSKEKVYGTGPATPGAGVEKPPEYVRVNGKLKLKVPNG